MGEEAHHNFLELIIIIGTGKRVDCYGIVCACIPLAGWGWLFTASQAGGTYTEVCQKLPLNDMYLQLSFEFLHRWNRWSAKHDATVSTRSYWQL